MQAFLLANGPKQAPAGRADCPRQYRHCSCYIPSQTSEDEDKRRNDIMKKTLSSFFPGFVSTVFGWLKVGHSSARTKKVTKFNSDAESLILGLQQYREFVGSFPRGTTSRSPIPAGSREKNPHPRGAQMPINIGRDPGSLGTPLMFLLRPNEVLIRSAGPTRLGRQRG